MGYIMKKEIVIHNYDIKRKFALDLEGDTSYFGMNIGNKHYKRNFSFH